MSTRSNEDTVQRLSAIREDRNHTVSDWLGRGYAGIFKKKVAEDTIKTKEDQKKPRPRVRSWEMPAQTEIIYEGHVRKRTST
jgi:pullulanase/glycogen debranching enzyme